MRNTKQHTDLQFGPLDPAYAPHGVSPGQLCAVDQFRFG